MKKCIGALIFLFALLVGPIEVSAQVQLGQSITNFGAGDYTGWSISISADGKRVAVGSPFYDRIGQEDGLARVFEWNGFSWQQLGSNIYGEAVGDKFGYAVALSSDGKRLAVGATDNAGSGFDAGHVRIYEWSGGNWNQMGGDIDGEAARDISGGAVTLSSTGNRVAIGAKLNDGNGNASGHVRVYGWVLGSWVQVGSDIDGESYSDISGEAISFSANGMTLAIGASGNLNTNGSSAGHVRVYGWGGSSWNQIGGDIDGEAREDMSGRAVSLSSNGTRVAIGAPLNDDKGNAAGHVRVYERIGNVWVQMGADIDGEALGDNLGTSVSLSADGTTLAAGAKFNGPVSGHVRIFQWHANAWYKVGLDIDGDRGSRSGHSVSLAANGQRVAIGAYNGHDKMYHLESYIQKGFVRQDTNSNCIADSVEYGFRDIPVIFDNGLHKQTGFTDSTGVYFVLLDTGTYDVSMDPSAYPYHKVCPKTQQIRIDTNHHLSSQTNFVLQDSILCPYLTVEISTPFIRRCFPGTYTVSYCNKGTQNVYQSFVLVNLDQHLTFTSSSLPLFSQVGNTMRFFLDTVRVGDCGSFTIDFSENCQSVIGQEHCTDAHIFPDSICYGELPNLRITPVCRQDTLVYHLHNLADDFPQSLPYYIVDDVGIRDTGSLFLTSGQQQEILYLADTSSTSYQLVISPNDQVYYTATGLRGCQTNTIRSTSNYLAHLPQAYQDIDCHQNSGSFDPNDKQCVPAGIGPNHHLVPNTPLEYTIRFQNTGTDTAFFINIVDTLSAHLDIGTFRPGISSHPYRLTYLPPTDSGQQVLKFVFDPILLPDSGRNQVASNGFVKYRIQMEDNLPVGTRIENGAAIYFDYNEPVITNKVFHTLHLPDTSLCLSNAGIDQIASCGAYTWIDGVIYTSSNTTAFYALTNATGCDSIVTLNLTIGTVNTAITNLSPTLQATASNATYQWLDCNNAFSPIAGATSHEFTATVNGSYAVTIQQNGCIDTSACLDVSNVSIYEYGFGEALRVYPNPTGGQLHIDLGAAHTDVSIRVKNVLGQEVAAIDAEVMQQGELELKGSPGVYLVDIRTREGGFVVVKIVKQ